MPVSEMFNTGGEAGVAGPQSQGIHHWLAGAGVRGGTAYGETDELGEAAAVEPASSPTCTQPSFI